MMREFAIADTRQRLSADVMGSLADEYFRSLDLKPWNRFLDIPWDRLDVSALDDDQRSVVQYITFIEDHLPGYFLEYQRLFPVGETTSHDDYVHNRELYRFSVKWAQEEEAHAHVLYHYQVAAGIETPQRLRAKLADEGRKPFHLDHDPIGVFTYTLIQEKATQLFYQAFEDIVVEPVLKAILRHLIRDEARHFAFFSRVLKAYLDEFGEQAIPSIRRALEQFKMPLSNTLRGYWRWSLRIADTVGGYDHSEAYEHLARMLRSSNIAAAPSTRELIEAIAQIRARV